MATAIQDVIAATKGSTGPLAAASSADTAGSITQAAEVVLVAGATQVFVSAIHPGPSRPARQRVQGCGN